MISFFLKDIWMLLFTLRTRKVVFKSDSNVY